MVSKQENGIKLFIMNSDSKFHTKALVTKMAEFGIQVYHGSGKKPWVILTIIKFKILKIVVKTVILLALTIACQMRLSLQTLKKKHNLIWRDVKIMHISVERC